MNRAYAALFIILGFIFVQPGWAGADQATRFEQQTAATEARLNLTGDQLAQVRPALQNAAQAQRQVLLGYGIDLEAGGGTQPKLGIREARKLRGELTDIQSNTRKKLEGILTTKQLDEFGRVQEENRKELKKRIQGTR